MILKTRLLKRHYFPCRDYGGLVFEMRFRRSQRNFYATGVHIICGRVVRGALMRNLSFALTRKCLTLRFFFAGFAPLREITTWKLSLTQRRQVAKLRKVQTETLLLTRPTQ